MEQHCLPLPATPGTQGWGQVICRNTCGFITFSGRTDLLPPTRADNNSRSHFCCKKPVFTVPAGTGERGIACTVHAGISSPHRQHKDASHRSNEQFHKAITGGCRIANPQVEEAFVRERKAARHCTATAATLAAPQHCIAFSPPGTCLLQAPL